MELQSSLESSDPLDRWGGGTSLWSLRSGWCGYQVQFLSGDGIRVKGGKGEGDNGEGEALLALGASLPSSAVQPYFSVLQL